MRWTKKEVFIQKFKWFMDGFLCSWLFIIFLMGFFWIATGSGQSQMKEPVVNAGITGDQAVQWNTGESENGEEKPGVFLQIMGVRMEISLSQMNTALQVYKKWDVIVPPKYRLAIDLIGLIAKTAFSP